MVDDDAEDEEEESAQTRRYKDKQRRIVKKAEEETGHPERQGAEAEAAAVDEADTTTSKTATRTGTDRKLPMLRLAVAGSLRVLRPLALAPLVIARPEMP